MQQLNHLNPLLIEGKLDLQKRVWSILNLFATLVQGVLMNAILLAVMLPIYAVCRMLGIPNIHLDAIDETQTANPFKAGDIPETRNPFATTDEASLQSD